MMPDVTEQCDDVTPAQLLAPVTCVAGCKVEDAAARSHELAKAGAEALRQQALEPACAWAHQCAQHSPLDT